MSSAAVPNFIVGIKSSAGKLSAPHLPTLKVSKLN